MDDSLSKFPLSFDVQRLVQSQLWNEARPNPHLPQFHGLISTYFEYYTTRCQRFLRDGSIHVLLKRHSDIIEIAHSISRGNPTWDEVKTYVELKYPPPGHSGSAPAHDEAVRTTINLCASLLIMAEVGTHKYGVSGWNPLPWPEDESLRGALGRRFHKQKTLRPDNQRIGSIFTARNIHHISGIRIKWTENIVDHLLLAEDDQALFVFPCVGFLRFQQSFKHPIYPDGFIDETLRTLTLLFPANDRKSRLWLKGIASSNDKVDRQLINYGSLRSHERRFEGFDCWHDRLVILKQAFDDSSPRTLSQWWNDRRNSVQWYTFWVAIMVFIMTVVFGVVQSIEGGLQVYFSWKALHP